jgi:hypothetical protein
MKRLGRGMPGKVGSPGNPLRHTRPKWLVALLAMVLSFPLHRAEARPDDRLWRALVTGFKTRGVTVVTSHPRCRQPSLEGLYTRGRTEVVVCRQGKGRRG